MSLTLLHGPLKWNTRDGGGSDAPLTKNAELDIQDEPEKALDGGFAWVVLVCAFAVQFIAGGAVLIGGVFVVEFKEAFDVTPAEASWVAAINTGIAYGCYIPFKRRHHNNA
ncbi:hypothetical protein CAPTEDRAFT_209154 [Capitella teleta]|uniref:Major facilitator superfamily (MFS) profile domain-containing protein n=1 Tax=Capitella teleta TaxID=283909 RepID=R7V9Y8_CAPTE|nr:hypothetical protein CAPTEDRAFT_209154 [Capitella teleta]|eukprot:ELU15327.1 hypothetical protein CAPTEDRAFT_209154 [Capitella teleta]